MLDLAIATSAWILFWSWPAWAYAIFLCGKSYIEWCERWFDD